MPTNLPPFWVPPDHICQTYEVTSLACKGAWPKSDVLLWIQVAILGENMSNFQLPIHLKIQVAVSKNKLIVFLL